LMRIFLPCCVTCVKRRWLSYVISNGWERWSGSIVSPKITYSSSPLDVNRLMTTFSSGAGCMQNQAPSPTPPRYCASLGTEIGLEEKLIYRMTISSGSKSAFFLATLSPSFFIKKPKDCQRFIRKYFRPCCGVKEYTMRSGAALTTLLIGLALIVSGKLMLWRQLYRFDERISIRAINREQLLLLRATAPYGKVPWWTQSSTYAFAFSKLMSSPTEKYKIPSPYIACFNVSKCSTISSRLVIPPFSNFALSFISKRGSENFERARPYPRGAIYRPKS